MTLSGKSRWRVMMARKRVSRPQAPKPRNWLAEQVRDPQGPFREQSIKDKTKHKRRPKHPKQVDFRDE
jgi:hypothetical protein